MADAHPVEDDGDHSSAGLSRPAQALIRAVLSLPPEAAAEVRASSGGRRRPRRQLGPSADYGEAGPR